MTFSRRCRALLCALVALALVTSAVACAPQDQAPRGVAQSFAGDWERRDFAGAAGVTTDPGRAEPTLATAFDSLDAQSLDVRIGKVRVTKDSAVAEATYTWTLAGGQEWSYPAEIPLGRSQSGWSVRWTPTVVHPDLGAGQRLVLSTTAPPRAAVNEADGSHVMENGTIIAISFDGSRAGRAPDTTVAQSVADVVRVLGPLIPGLSVQAIAERATASDEPVFLGRISAADYDRLRDQLAIPGVVTTDEAILTPTDPNFAPALLGKVRDTVEAELGGTPGWRIEVVGENSLVNAVLADHPAEPAPAVSLTLSRTVQDAAQRAVNAIGGRQTMMVVLQASTGKILAVAQNAAADRDGPIALIGQYPPGSTFKMVTSAAAMNAGLSDPAAIVPCPGEIQVGDRLIPNYNGFALGPVPLQVAFANSCNTSFADLAGRMGPSDLAHAAAAMGLVTQYEVPGVDVKSGSVPIEPDLVQRAEDGFGQGRTLASPLGMALVAGTAASGHTPTPTLINGRETTVIGPRPALAEDIYAQLRPMMRAVVTSGTATNIAGAGDVHGKTGEAEFAGGSHAWFAGFRGDLAFATLIVGGGDSTNSVNVTRDFFAFLPDGFRPA